MMSSSNKSPFGKLAAFAVVMSMFLAAITMPVAAADGSTSAGNNDAGNVGLAIGVQQGAGNVAVTVTYADNGTLTSNASIEVTSDNDYVGDGSHMSDSNGQLILPGPSETVNATITAEKGSLSRTKEVTLRASNGSGPAHVPRGIRVASLAHSLQDGVFPGRMGQLVAGLMTSFWDFPSSNGHGPSTAENPGQSSSHSPPGHAKGQGNKPNGSDNGPPENPGRADNDDENDEEPGKSDNGHRGNSGNNGNPGGNGKAKGR